MAGGCVLAVLATMILLVEVYLTKLCVPNWELKASARRQGACELKEGHLIGLAKCPVQATGMSGGYLEARVGQTALSPGTAKAPA